MNLAELPEMFNGGHKMHRLEDRARSLHQSFSRHILYLRGIDPSWSPCT